MSVSGPKDKHSVLSPYNRILLLSHKKEILIQVTAWMNIENIMLGKRNQKQKVWSRHIYSDRKINDCGLEEEGMRNEL